MNVVARFGAECETLPACIAANPHARFAWDEFFCGQIRNPHTRLAYQRAVRRFLRWCEARQIRLQGIEPGHVGDYLSALPLSVASRKLQLAALRAFFDLLVNRHLLLLNPAASVRGERYKVVEGKTPEISREQIRTLLASIDTVTPVGLRDKAIIAMLVYTAARAGAIARLRHRDLQWDGTQFTLRFLEKGGQFRRIPVRHDLQQLLTAYLNLIPADEDFRDVSLFRTVRGRTGLLTSNGLTGLDVCRLVKRRLSAASLPTIFSPHSFRVATVTNLLSQELPLEDVQDLIVRRPSHDPALRSPTSPDHAESGGEDLHAKCGSPSLQSAPSRRVVSLQQFAEIRVFPASNCSPGTVIKARERPCWNWFGNPHR